MYVPGKLIHISIRLLQSDEFTREHSLISERRNKMDCFVYV